MKAVLLPVHKPESVDVKGESVSILAETRSRPHLQVRLWGKDSSGEIVILEEVRRKLVDVTKTEIGLPQYAHIVPLVRLMKPAS